MSRRATVGALLLAGLPVAGSACGDEGGARASLSVVETLAATDTAGYARATQPRPLAFPRDHGPHPEFKHEWWYFTGNLQTAEGRDFGFQLTLFRSALRPDPATVESDWAARQAYMGHFAVADVDGEAFLAHERFDRGALGLAGARSEPLRVWVGDWEVGSISISRSISRGPGGAALAVDSTSPGGAARPERPAFRLRAAEGAVAIDLVLESLKPVVLQGDRGLSRKGPEPGNASYYYSLTRLAADGTLTLDGVTHQVRGLAWLDREWSTSALSPGLVGWDWFSLQLDDGSELMLYRLRARDGGTSPFSAGTFVAPGGGTTSLAADDFVLEATGAWSSPRGGRYPAGWRLRVPTLDLQLDVAPRLADQELDLAFRYWEGTVAVEGSREGRTVAGLGYVELTGYGGEDGGP